MRTLAIQRTGPVVTSQLLLPLQDLRSKEQRDADLLQAKNTEKIYRDQRVHNPLISQYKELFPLLFNPKLKKLVVFIHGLGSSPLAWSEYLKDRSISYFVPEVLKRGNCSVNDAATPILRFLEPYSSCHTVIVGHSRGAVIGGYVERCLKKRQVDFISIAGPHGGNLHLNTYFNSFVINQLQQWQSLPTKGDRLFIGSADDETISPLNTCFPNIPNSEYRLLAGTSHTEIIEAVRTDVLAKITQFFSNT